MVLLIIIPFLNGYFIGNIPYFQTNPVGIHLSIPFHLFPSFCRLLEYMQLGKPDLWAFPFFYEWPTCSIEVQVGSALIHVQVKQSEVLIVESRLTIFCCFPNPHGGVSARSSVLNHKPYTPIIPHQFCTVRKTVHLHLHSADGGGSLRLAGQIFVEGLWDSPLLFFGEDDDDLNRERNSQKWWFGLVHTVVLSSMKGSGRLQAQPSESCKVKKVQGLCLTNPIPFAIRVGKWLSGTNATSWGMDWMQWSGQRIYHDPPGNAMPQRLGTVPHTEPINTKAISSKMPYQAAITQRCPTRNQNSGTACTAPSTWTVHVNLDAGVTGEFSTSACKWSSQHHCTRSSPPEHPLGARRYWVPGSSTLVTCEMPLPMPTSRLRWNISLEGCLWTSTLLFSAPNLRMLCHTNSISHAAYRSLVAINP